MNRRRFLALALSLAAAPLWLTWRTVTRVYVEAVRTHRYRGPIKRGDPAAISKPGRWAG